MSSYLHIRNQATDNGRPSSVRSATLFSAFRRSCAKMKYCRVSVQKHPSPRRPIFPTLQHRHPPSESVAQGGRLVWGTVRYNRKAEASTKSLALPCRDLLGSQCAQLSHPQKTSFGRMYSRSLQGRTAGHIPNSRLVSCMYGEGNRCPARSATFPRG